MIRKVKADLLLAIFKKAKERADTSNPDIIVADDNAIKHLSLAYVNICHAEHYFCECDDAEHIVKEWEAYNE